MLPGDIDLTENLDFRKSRLKETPQLPSVWNGIDNKLNTPIISTTNTSSFTVVYNDDLYLNTVSINTDISPIISHSYTMDYYDNYNFTINYSSYYNSTTTGDHCYKINIKDLKSEHNIFGNIIECKNIPSLPWNDDKISYREPKISWDKNLGYRLYFNNDNNKIPWIINDIYQNSIDNETPDLDIKSRAKNLISWLFDKSERFIKDYLNNNDDVDLSYLTNMRWIRVKDAIIDP